MPLKIVKAQVYDPALSGHYREHARLEITVRGMPEEPTHTDLGSTFSVMRYHWLAKIYSDAPGWDAEQPEANAVIYNTSIHTEFLEPYVPVTVSWEELLEGEFGEVFYMKLSRAKRIARSIEIEQGSTGYEWLPDPTWLGKKHHGWYLQHANRMCVECVQDRMSEEGPLMSQVRLASSVPSMCKLYPVYEHRLIALCSNHGKKFNAQWAESTVPEDSEVIDV